jgi:hypothetical protein
MNRVSKTLTVGILTGAVLVAGTARAQTATTVTTSSTTTSTSTTLLPHPFSPDTRACIKDARQAYKQCAGTKDDCTKAFRASYAKCFAGSAGEKCATKCLTNESKCVTAVPTTKKSCRKTCRTTRKNDIRACKRIPDGENIWAAGDQGCLTTARLTFSTCKWQCSGAKDVCHTNFRFCIADCPNQ